MDGQIIRYVLTQRVYTELLLVERQGYKGKLVLIIEDGLILKDWIIRRYAREAIISKKDFEVKVQDMLNSNAKLISRERKHFHDYSRQSLL